MTSQSVTASEQLLTRRKIRTSFIEWARHCGYEPAAHQRLLISELEALERGDIQRLMVFMPPGSAKSTYGSVLLPAWYLARHPKDQIVCCSHTEDLSLHFSRRVQALVSDNKRLLGTDLAAGNSAARHWSLTSGGSYLAAGVGQGIAGYRADLIVIDDPVRSRADADSELVRESTHQWFAADLRTRLRPGGRILLIMTRWNFDDLAGRLLAEMEAGRERWEVVSLPAEAEDEDLLGRAPGTMLWGDDAYGYAKQLRHEKTVQSVRNWSALYQQRPTPDTGDYFKEEWLITYSTAPDRVTLSVYGASDYAVTSNGGDYTAHVVVGIDPAGNMWLLDLWRKQASSDVWIEALCDLIRKWKPFQWGEEKIQITAGIGPHLVRRMRERNAFTMRQQFATRGDKAVRARSIQARMASIGLHVPAGAPWFADLRSELLHFPAGKHDDIVDALGLIGQLLEGMITGKDKKPGVKPRFDPTVDEYQASAPSWSDYAQSSVKLL
jgi:predicted phage terminase large subunit-like protein